MGGPRAAHLQHASRLAWIILILSSPAIAAAAEPGVFSIADFGAKPGVDSRQAIQAAVDAAIAFAGQSKRHSAVVEVPLQAYMVAGPIYRDGERITIVGRGIGSVLTHAPGYGGPILVDGIGRLTRSEAAGHRPRSRLLDATAGAHRLALATRGTHALVVNEHPLQLGGPPEGVNACRADYFQRDHYTLECLIARPSGATWPDGVTLLGSMKGNDPEPYALAKTDSGFKLLMTAADGVMEAAFINTPGLAPGAVDRGPWRICIQVDREAGRCSAWINNRAAAVSAALRPGVKLRAPDGSHAWVFGSRHGIVPAGPDAVVDVELHGFMVSAGAKYRVDRPSQVRVDGTAVTDETRYFARTRGPVETAAWLPLDDPGGTLVRLGSQFAAGAGFWLAAERRAPSSELALQDLTIAAGEQAAILLGDCWGSRLTRVRAGDSGSFAGLASIGVMSYPVNLDECQFLGTEAGCSLYQTICHARNCTLAYIGRTGFLVCGGSATLDGTFVSFQGPDCQSYITLRGMGAGGVFRVIDSIIDNEELSPSDAVIRFEQVPNAVNRLVIDGLDAALPGPNGLIRLVGSGLGPEQWGAASPTWSPLKVEIKNVGRTAKREPILRIDGPPGWVHGTFDASEQPTAAVLGTPGPRLVVIPPAFPAAKSSRDDR